MTGYFGSEDALFEEVLGEDFAWSFRFCGKKILESTEPEFPLGILEARFFKEGIERNYVTKLTNLSLTKISFFIFSPSIHFFTLSLFFLTNYFL